MSWRLFGFPALLYVAVLLSTPLVVQAREQSPATMGRGSLPAQAASCTDLVTPDRVVALDLPGLNPPGALGNPELCLLSYPDDDVYHGIILSLDDAAQFDAAKADATSQLPSLGIDLCRIAAWEARGPRAIALDRDRQQNLPLDCAPRILAADAGAAALLPTLQDVFAQIVGDTTTQIGWRPIRALTVKVLTDVNVAIPLIQQYMLSVLPGETPESLAQRTRNGGSWHKVADPILGNLILLNLTRPGSRTLAGERFGVAFTYTSYANSGLTGNSSGDHWFRQGLDTFQAERNGGAAAGYLALAAQDQRTGKETTPLSDLTTLDRWLAHQRAEGGPNVQARGHAAFVFLTEQVGFDALIQLLQQNHDGTLQSFEALLANLTGMDQPALDQAFAAWLSGVSSFTARGGANFHVDVTASSGQTYAELTLTFDQVIPCGGNRQVAAGTTLTIGTLVASTGPFAVAGNVAAATVTVSGTLTTAGVSGTIQFVNPVTGCDTGMLPFGS